MPSLHSYLFFLLPVTLYSVSLSLSLSLFFAFSPHVKVVAQSDFSAQAAGKPSFSTYDDFSNLLLASADATDEVVPEPSSSVKVQLSNEDQCSAETPPKSRRMRSRSDTYCPYKPQAPTQEFMGPELTRPELQGNPAQEPLWRKIPFLQNWFRPLPKKPAKKSPIIDFDSACHDPARQVRVCSIWAPFILPAPSLIPTLPFCRYSTLNSIA